MDHARMHQQTGQIGLPDDVPSYPNGSGPLQRRISAAGQPVEPELRDTASLAMQYATIALLDGTVIGRLACDRLLGEIVVGRGSLAGVRVDDPFVHRVHSEIRWDADLRSHVIAHAGGSNGTYVNLQRVDRPTRLIDGARIRIGKTELIYRRVYYPGD
ncbi:MAG TPA: FHA domain-containing protein [Thermomicrobiales bacterium]|nr:FHA domain-containing protein [Thermomicrobiales bacterium]